MSNNLEFHYVVSYREGCGWSIAVDTEDAVMPDGTIYDWGEYPNWTFPYNPEVEALDLQHYAMLQSALRQLNEGEINA